MAISFRQFLGRIGEAAMYAQDIASSAADRKWQSRCNVREGDDGGLIYTPKMLQMEMPTGITVEVPELGLTFPYQLPIDRLRIKFEAQVDMSSGDGDDDTFHYDMETGPQILMSAKRGLFKNATHFEVEAIFAMQPPTEIQEALRDNLTMALKNALEGHNNGGKDNA